MTKLIGGRPSMHLLAFASALLLGPPLGITWGPVYGFPPHPPERFAPQARALGASFTRITLYWSQLEPEPGRYRWDDLDAYLAQIAAPEEAVLTIASASPWATRRAAWVFPSSPAKDPATYSAFVRAVVAHAAGRIRYFQSDPEPNNPFFYDGDAEAYAAQQRRFYAAVKEADPRASVILGGCDGLFDPTGAHPVPGQDADMAYFSTLIARAADAYDIFDLRLYGDPYGIPDRVRFVRDAMAKAGGLKPIVATEYDGPGFFEFPANRRHYATMMGPAASPDAVRALIASAAMLPVETRMFLPGASAADAALLERLQADDLIARNLIALSAGVQKTAFFDFWHEPNAPDGADAVTYGSFRLFDRQGDDFVRRPLAGTFARLAALLADATSVERMPQADPAYYVFRIARRAHREATVSWHRPSSLVDDGPEATPQIVE